MTVFFFIHLNMVKVNCKHQWREAKCIFFIEFQTFLQISEALTPMVKTQYLHAWAEDIKITRVGAEQGWQSAGTCGYRLFVVEVNVMRQETACVLNTAVWTLPGHTVPVSQPDFHLFSCCSESNASSLTPAASLFSSSFIPVFITLFVLSTWKTFTVSSPLLLLPCCSCVFCSDTGTICNTNSSVSKRWCRRVSSLVGTQQQHLYDLEVQWWDLQYVMIVTTVKQVCNICRSRNAR